MAKTLSAREIMEKLVSFPTVSSDTNLPLIDWVEEYLQGHGVKTNNELIKTQIWHCGSGLAP